MCARSALEPLAIAYEVSLTAHSLFVMDSRYGEMQMAYLLADNANPARLGDLTGKYVQRATGSAHMRENGDARWLDELPADVSPDDVVVDDLDVSNATPLQDRLREIARMLRSDDEREADLDALAEAIDTILEACRPGNGERLSAQISQWVQSEVFDADGPGDANDIIKRANRFLDRLGQLAQELQDASTGDGRTIGGILAVRTLILARAAAANDPDQKADALI
jgi:hypothetical protein